MPKTTGTYIALVILLMWQTVTIAQIGFSPRIDSMMNAVTTATLSLLDRQLSGDTSILIDGVHDTVKSRYSYSDYNLLASEFIFGKFQDYGLSVEYQDYSSNGRNVIATKAGSVFPSRQYIICSHYDDLPSTGFATGADDNASGTCGVIEAARLCSHYSFPYTIKFIAFDEEEEMSTGSQAYVNEAYANQDTILGVLDLDMIAWDSNADFAFSISTDSASMPLFVKYIDILKLYQPVLSPSYTELNSSDHSSFWNFEYPAILAIEDYPWDFNPYPHTLNDNFSNLNMPFFLAMARGAVAAIATMAWDYRMELHHIPLASQNNTSAREATLTINSPFPVASGENGPRLYYKIDSGFFNYVEPYYANLDTFKFMIPGQSCGSKVSYYFAACDQGGNFVATLPAGGKGIDPPGSQPGINYFSYNILNESNGTYSAPMVPERIYGNTTTVNSLSIATQGIIQDINVRVTLTHTNTMDISLFLVSPGGIEIELSSNNGYTYDLYTNTLFDDEAETYINQNKPPFTGSFKPEKPLWILDNSYLAGEWKLKIVNHRGVIGTLRHWSIEVKYLAGYYFVDASKPISGDGRSWATPYKTISEAASQNPAPGSVVFIKPGDYHEQVNITSNGSAVIPITSGVTISGENRITFPTGTDLSLINLTDYPGEYFAYVYRSRNFNNGYYKVIDVNDAEDFILVECNDFVDEEGSDGDFTFLSASVGRPVRYMKYVTDPINERVIIDVGGDIGSQAILYIGDPIGDGSSEALPANLNMIDGIDLTGSINGGGIHLQCSSFNIIANCRIFNINGDGIYLNGNGDRPSKYNMIFNNEIHNTPPSGIAVGSQGNTSFNNNAHFNLLLQNEIFVTGSEAFSSLDKAIVLNEFTSANQVDKNYIHDIVMSQSGEGVISIASLTDYTMVSGNTIKDIMNEGAADNSMIYIDGNNQGVEVLNNVIYNSLPAADSLYAFHINGTNNSGSRVVHNTISNLDRGFLLEDYGEAIDFAIQDNIIVANGHFLDNLGTTGRFSESYNLFSSDPTPDPGIPYYGSPGRQVGDPAFRNSMIGDFHLTILSDKAVCTALPLNPVVETSFDGVIRNSEAPDMGSFELDSKNVWIGASDRDWQNALNWSQSDVPDSFQNAIILSSTNEPIIYSGTFLCKGLQIKPGCQLELRGNSSLILNESTP